MRCLVPPCVAWVFLWPLLQSEGTEATTKTCCNHQGCSQPQALV